MNSVSNPLPQGKNEVLVDETRFSIYVYLMVHKELTLKQLSEYLLKGKTTIHHHIRKLEENGIVKYREDKKDARRQLKTRYYSLRFSEYSSEDKKSAIDLMKIEGLVISKLLDWWISYLESQSESIDRNDKTSTLEIDLTPPINSGVETIPFTNLNATIKIPILDILRWKEKNIKK